jgi:hypothetical protein
MAVYRRNGTVHDAGRHDVELDQHFVFKEISSNVSRGVNGQGFITLLQIYSIKSPDLVIVDYMPEIPTDK